MTGNSPKRITTATAISHRGRALRLLPGMAVVGLAALSVNLWLCGRLLPSGYGQEALGWDAPFLEGTMAWLISPGRGLFFYSPVFLFSLLGLCFIWKRSVSESSLVAR